jgi:hypothetical protein
MTSSSAVRNYLESCNSKIMKNVVSRKTFARKLCKISGYANLEEMILFVQEMRGLDFYRSEDRAIFYDFFYAWVKEENHESFNA